jgi:2-octaprenyl-6-methoxyphenol hydroxylase|tara:strand:+ start:1228 stop:2385 length:1158 start_codon:yes stop_codon:yes gene_type:complete
MNKAIVIIGGGPVGLIFALLNQINGLDTLILESKSENKSLDDRRGLALSNGSRFILERIGVWEELVDKLTAIESIHTSQKGTFGRTLMKAKEFNQDALGYIVSYGVLIGVLQEKLKKSKKINILYNTKASQFIIKGEKNCLKYHKQEKEYDLLFDLLVLADGGNDAIPGIELSRSLKSFGHSALVTQVVSELPHQNIAYERFTPGGPIALLPNLKDKFSLVWTGKKNNIEELMQLNDKDFLKKLHNHFGDRVGDFISCEDKVIFPLKQSFVDEIKIKNVVVIGNSAQTIHPVAGQGLNTGLRDALSLSDCIESNSGLANINSLIMEYIKLREIETKKLMRFTEILVKGFSNDIVGINKLRGIALSLLDLNDGFKKTFVRKMSIGR